MPTQKIGASGLALFVAALLSMFASQASAAKAASPLLRCEVIYAGAATIVEASPVQDVYGVPSVDIGERFRFKAVMAGTDKAIRYIKLYAYLQTRRTDVPIHEAVYLPPYRVSDVPYALTPQNYLYAGDVERELQYHCSLQGVQP